VESDNEKPLRCFKRFSNGNKNSDGLQNVAKENTLSSPGKHNRYSHTQGLTLQIQCRQSVIKLINSKSSSGGKNYLQRKKGPMWPEQCNSPALWHSQ
jgi:hypothetical protein